MDGSRRLEGAWLALAALLLLLPGTNSLGLWAPDEPRAAAVTREMFARPHGAESWVLLRLNDEPYTQKPPLYYWLAAAASAVPGRVTEGSARVPSVLAGVATLLLTLGFGRLLFGARSAWLGAALLLTNYEFMHLARRVQFDVLLTFFELGALAAFWRLDRGIGSARAARALAHASMGAAMLVKGPVGFLVPMLVMFVYLTSERRLGAFARLFSGVAPGAPAAGLRIAAGVLGNLSLSLGPVLLWLAAAVALAPPGFFGTAVGDGVVSRFFEGTSHARPFYYYAYQFPIDFLPWTLLLPAVWVVARRSVFVPAGDPDRRRAWRFALACVGTTLVFFSLSAGKRGLYLLPCFPLLALLCGDALRTLLAERARPPRALAWGSAALGLAVAAVGVWAFRAEHVAGASLPARAALGLVAIPLLGAVAWQACVQRGRVARLPYVLVATAYGVLAVAFWQVYPALDPIRSMKPVAEAARRWAPEHERIALVGSRPMIGGLSYYAERPVHWLDDVEDVPAYFASGGTTLVAKAKKLERIRAQASIVVRERLREGDRELVVVQRVAAGG